MPLKGQSNEYTSIRTLQCTQVMKKHCRRKKSNKLMFTKLTIGLQVLGFLINFLINFLIGHQPLSSNMNSVETLHVSGCCFPSLRQELSSNEIKR